MSLDITILGCGNSTGVPAIGNYWGKCDPNEPKNHRMRCSILVKSEKTTLLIDTGPDFKHQINRTDVEMIDAVLFTHEHSDHTQGMDELRMIRHRSGAEVPIYGDQATINELTHRFKYLFYGGESDIYPPIVEPYVFKNTDFGADFTVGDITFVPFIQDHGTCETVGYRFGDFGYSVDLLTLNEQAIEILKGIDVWVVDCAGYGHESNPVHANLEEVMRLNEQIGAKRVYLSSLTLAADYQTLLKELPDGYLPAHDGLKFKI